MRYLAFFLIAGLIPAASRVAPVPNDPLELASGQLQRATPESRTAALDLLSRARNNFNLRSPGLGYDLKVSFTVDSRGQTDHDGAWELEDLFVPGLGLHWTARSSSGYTVTGLAANRALFAEGTANAFPLRLEEARGILLHPLPSAAYAGRESIRSFSTSFRGTQVTCILLSTAKNAALPESGRAWEESEECIDPQSGLLQLHSEAPGRYVVYDYANGPQLSGHTLPRTVTVNEGGRLVSTISVEKLEEVQGGDPNMFAPTDKMKEQGRSVEMAPMTKTVRVHGQPPFPSAMTVRPVCVFGIVSSSGRLLEAHSLQPMDPNSQAAVEDAKQIDFSHSTPPGAPPAQHFVFVIDKFFSR